jgi:tRNA(adenine34) deaminase
LQLEASPLVLGLFFFYKCLVTDQLIVTDDDMESVRHEHYMHMALEEARKAFRREEVPVGAVLVDDDNAILARAHNRTITDCDPSAHAEMLALRQAAGAIHNYRLLNTTLYVSVEPCVMCMGAIIHARVARVVFGAHDPKWGAGGSLYHFGEDHRFNHHPDIIEGILLDECRDLMRAFFRSRRAQSDPGAGS